ncbi:MAG: hypothetical protein LBG52_00900 [Candidatus Peribacteria bacterium]|nr:hypothetical protein [Candidatus Peribacteria bacterium]
MGKQKNPEQDKGNTKVKDETSETKVKDIDYEIDRGQVEVVDVDIDLPGGYHVTADREGNLWVTGPNLPTDGVLAVKTETGIVFTPPSIPNSGVSVDPIAPPATGSKGSHMDQTSNMVADVQVKNAVATKK